MTAPHPMTVEADNGEDVVLVCPVETCGRRVVASRSGGLVVVHQGDFFAFHAGGTVGLDVAPLSQG